MALGHSAKVRSGEITDLRDYALLSLRAWRSSDGEVEIGYDVVSAEEQPNPYYARKLAWRAGVYRLDDGASNAGGAIGARSGTSARRRCPWLP